MTPHIPVMLTEVMTALKPEVGGVYIDCTFGAGGYSREILRQGGSNIRLVGIDRDPDAIRRAKDIDHPGFSVIEGKFSELSGLVPPEICGNVSGVVFDLGVSSMQLDEAARGFSFKHDGPLDMRMGKNDISAADVVNNFSAKRLSDIIYYYGEDRDAKRITRAIVERRAIKPFATTLDLAAVVKSAKIGTKTLKDPATQTFQALRIFVNQELDEINAALTAAFKMLKVGGRLVVVTFHSLEDRIVKNFFAEKSGKSDGISRYDIAMASDAAPPVPVMELMYKKPVLPGNDELSNNPRSRSAKLRAAVKIREGS